MMPRTIFGQIMTMAAGLVIAIAGIAGTFVFMLPLPSPGRINVEEMQWALGDNPSSVIELERREYPPSGLRTSLVEASLAEALDRHPSDIRAIWHDRPSEVGDAEQSIILIDQQDAVIKQGPDGYTLRMGGKAKLHRDTFVPLFVAAVRTSDGAWLWGIPQDPARNEWRSRVLMGLLAVAVLTLTISWFFSRKLAAPVEALSLAARGARLSDDAPYPVEGPRETRVAGQAMNAMHLQMQDAATERLTTAAAVAHDIGTPITALRLRVEGLSEPLRTRMADDLQRVSTLLTQLLDYARMSSIDVTNGPIDLSQMAADICAQRQDLGQNVQIEECSEETVKTDGTLLVRALDNLIDNALEFGTNAKIRVNRDEQSVSISVTDNGPGITGDGLIKAVKPFVRLDPSRNRRYGGAGLGLANVSAITELLGAKFILDNVSSGLCATIRWDFYDVIED